GHRLVGDSRDARLHQIGGLLRIGREVAVGVEDLALAKLRALVRLGLLDLHHHPAFGKDPVGRLDDLRTRRAVLLVVSADAAARAALDQDRVAVPDQLLAALGRQSDAIFLVLDFAGAADQHGHSPLAGLVTYEAGRPQSLARGN